MEDPKTVKMGGDEPSGQATVHGGSSPFVRTPGSVPPASARPPAPSPPGEDTAGSATVLMSQRHEPVFAWLVVLDGPDRGRIHPLLPGATMVGRLPGNDIVVADDACSSQHARIRIERDAGGDERFLLIDMASRNGTFAGDRTNYRQNRVHHYVLHDGDFLLLGETTMVFKQV